MWDGSYIRDSHPWYIGGGDTRRSWHLCRQLLVKPLRHVVTSTGREKFEGSCVESRRQMHREDGILPHRSLS